MARARLRPYLSPTKLRRLGRHSDDPVERAHLEVIALRAEGVACKRVASASGYSAVWVSLLTARYNRSGPTALADGRKGR